VYTSHARVFVVHIMTVHQHNDNGVDQSMFDSQMKARQNVAKWFGVSTDDSQVQQNNLKWQRRSMVVHHQMYVNIIITTTRQDNML